ncbi:MAG TPA: Hsp20/alpha crystallin family protein [Flavisolibacter sp.]|jgi:HSP20 family protein|nr:Hsp20/alpha crystallin family protein [Flavisolibacter sp.]
MLKIFQHFSFGTGFEIQVVNLFIHLKNGGNMSIVKRNGNLGMTNLFDDVFSRDLFNWGLDNYSRTSTNLPAVNIRESAENFLVEMAAPGMNKQDFRIELDGNNLTISSEKTQNNEQRADEYYSRREFSYQSFQRSFTLPKDVVEVEQIQAKYENGVLNLVIPKKEEAKQKPPRTIQIS